MLLILLGAGIVSLGAATRTVDITGTGQYTSIQTALNASSPGDTVLVYPGRYYENVTIQTGSISLVGLEALTGDADFVDSTIIDGGLSSWGIWIIQSSQNVTIRGLSVTNCKVGVACGEDSSLNLINCNIYENYAINGAGVGLTLCTAFLSGVKIFDNYAINQGGGMYIYGYMGMVNVTFDPVNRCSIYNNRAGAGQDIVAHSINNNLSIPLDMFSVPNPTSYYAASYIPSGNGFPLLIDAQTAHHQEVNSDLYISPEGDDANDGISPTTALKTIKTAVYRIASDSLNPKTVHILPGTYSSTANQQVFPIALKSWVKVKGAGINDTQIIGEPNPVFTNQALKVFASFYQTHVSMEDMSITSENTDDSCALWGHQEDNLYLKNIRMNDLSPDTYAVIDITFAPDLIWDGIKIENFSTDSMGFLHSDGYITGTIRNCVFRNAVSTFMSSEVWAYPPIWANIGSHLTIENTIFSDITIMDNDTQAIALGYSYQTGVVPQYLVNNCLFSNINCNERAVLIQGNDVSITNISNSTFTGQSGNGHALLITGYTTITNCIFYNDRPKEIGISTYFDTNLTVKNSLIKGGYNGILQAPGNTINYMANNLDTNPLFAGGDISNPLYYSLAEGSPCINTGTPDTTGLSILPYDLAGNNRIWNGVIDMGCYEYGSEPYVSVDDPSILPLGVCTLSAYPNPFQSFTNLKVDLSSIVSGSSKPVQNACVNVYNIKGQKVKSIELNPATKGEQLSYWDGRDANNTQCSSGIYILHLQVNGKQVSSRKVTLVR
jgi:hypothetical protein